MKSLPVGEIKARFSEVLDEIRKGNSYGILYGKERTLIAEINPPKAQKKKGKRKLGLLAGKADVIFAPDFKMTEEEFINLR